LSPDSIGIGDEPIDATVVDQAVTRIGSLILRTVDILFAVTEDESVMPDLREIAAEALDVFDELEGETILTVLAALQTPDHAGYYGAVRKCRSNDIV
jgi:hypothetical protein